MRQIPVLVALALLGACAASAPPAPSPVGRWLSASGNVEVTIQPCGAALCGDVTRVFANNSMERLGATKVAPARVGLRILSGLRPDGDAWRGRIYDREQGRTYDCRIALGGPDTLAVRGYIALPVFGRTQTWRRMPA
jgi:uncharacterized protein (DUF2147 family)